MVGESQGSAFVDYGKKEHKTMKEVHKERKSMMLTKKPRGSSLGQEIKVMISLELEDLD